MRSLSRVPAAATVLSLAFAISPLTAHAAFPGRDGRIAFESEFVAPPCGFGSDPDCDYLARSIWSVKPDGRGQARVSDCDARANACRDADPAWSPDGRKIAFARDAAIWVSDANGANARPVGVGGTDPAWSPGGTRLVFTRGGGDSGIATVKLDGSGIRVLTRKVQDHGPTWSRTGVIAFARFSDSGERIMAVTPSGEELRTLVGGCFCAQPDFSPDGRQLAYQAGADPDVWVATSSGKHRRRLTRSGGSQPAWSPSGQRIAFTRLNGSVSDIYVMSAAGKAARRIGYNAEHRVGNEVTGSYGDPSWQPLKR